MIPSTNTDMGKLIRERLLTPPGADEFATLVDLTKAEVLVYQQLSLDSEIKAAVAKASGCAVVIEYSGFRTAEKNAGRPKLVETYNIAVWSKPIIDAGNLPADLVRKSIILRMWQWRPKGGHAFGEALPTEGGVSPSTSFLIYDCDVTIPVTL
jgi:hypothetical protein